MEQEEVLPVEIGEADALDKVLDQKTYLIYFIFSFTAQNTQLS